MQQTADYWQHKLFVYLHDPPHKAWYIPGHAGRAEKIIKAMDQTPMNRRAYQQADIIASGLTRAAVPGFNRDRTLRGSVDFAKFPQITHPLVEGESLTLEPATGQRITGIQQDLLDLIKKDVAGFPDGSAEEEAKTQFLYLFFALKKRLRNENTGGLGAVWDVIPADTRIPDHPIWHHMALTSAIASAHREDPNGAASLVLFSITPVQPFIARARKLRDHWCASVLLSYLAFTGLRHLTETLGPDHVVYPSLHDQTLVEEWLKRSCGLKELLKEGDEVLCQHMLKSKSIASFPNKFVFIAPTASVEATCKALEASINAEWVRLARIVGAFLGGNEHTKALIEHQVSDYWTYSFAATRLPDLDDGESLSALLHPETWRSEEETLASFAATYGKKRRQTVRLYSAAHSLLQRVLASAKLKPNKLRKPQEGEKCPLCGEHEVLHDLDATDHGKKARDYKEGIKSFWDKLRAGMNSPDSSSEIGENERLCAVCCIKRFLPRALKEGKLCDELLYNALTVKRFQSPIDDNQTPEADDDRTRMVRFFPSTTEIAATRYLERLKLRININQKQKTLLLNALHESEIDGVEDDTSSAIKTIIEVGEEFGVKYENRDKYYALLLMDGDRIGDLLNGTTMTATWGSVIHPELKRRYDDPSFQPPKDVLRGKLSDKRILNPALHAAISDSLNSFARFAVAPIVERRQGRLIYAGGDDVCAILPLDTVLTAADEIRKAYSAGFVRYTESGVEPYDGRDSGGKIGIHLGQAPGISISAGIMIAHHKTPLREVIRDTHTLLTEVAKKKGGRNAVAIRLSKRSGADRDFSCKWDEPNPFTEGESILDSFRGLSNSVGFSISTSLIYRLPGLKDGIAPLTANIGVNKEKIVKLYRYELAHSGLKNEDEFTLLDAQRLAGITLAVARGEVRCGQDGRRIENWYTPEAAVIAAFMAGKEEP